MIAGLDLVRNFLGHEEERELIAGIDAGAWRTDLKRRVQHYGVAYDYRRRSTGIKEGKQVVASLPDWGSRLIEKIRFAQITGVRFDQIIVNEYLPGQGIAAHVDSREFGDTIISVSLGSTCAMRFIHTVSKESINVWLMPGDLMCLTRDARYLWRHEIRPRQHDLYRGQVIRRQRRISVTMRTLASWPRKAGDC
jgi:alkylated DNA repair dioxygenase AlkB